MAGVVKQEVFSSELIRQAFEGADGSEVFLTVENYAAPTEVLVEDPSVPYNEIELFAEADQFQFPPNYKRETAGSISGYWSESDTHRLLRAYLKNVKAVPHCMGKPTNAVWERIASDFRESKKYSMTQIKTKILRLKSTARAIFRGKLQNETWPYLPAMTEILQLEGGLTVPENTVTAMWPMEETMKLLDVYERHQEELVLATSVDQKRIAWNKVAEEMRRQRHTVRFKINSLKNTWRKWENSGPTEWPFFHRMDELMTREKAMAMENETKQTRPEKAVPSRRWDAGETQELLQSYLEELADIKKSGEVVTRRCISERIADCLDLDADLVQSKLSGLKIHWKKHVQRNRSSQWPHADLLTAIMRLEGEIWPRFGKLESGEALDDGVEVTPIPPPILGKRKLQMSGQGPNKVEVVVDTSKIEEPAWFALHRANVLRRHKEKMEKRRNILSVLEHLFDSM